MGSLVIGITGGSGSGKTLFINQLVESFAPEDITLVSQDNYYKARDMQPHDDAGVRNFDTLESIDIEAFRADVESLIKGNDVTRLEYTYNNPSKKPETLTFRAAPVLLVEGLFVFQHMPIYQLLDLKVFIEAKPHIKLKRRIIRDQVERGYDLEDVLYRFENHVMPSYERHIEPFRHDSDIIIPNNSEFTRGMEVLAAYIREKLNS